MPTDAAAEQRHLAGALAHRPLIDDAPTSSREQVVLGLPPQHDDRRCAVAHRDHRRTRHVVVVAAPCAGSRRPVPGTARDRRAARRRAGTRPSPRCRRPRSACRPRGPAIGPASEARRASVAGVVGVVEGGADVVAHPAVDARRRCAGAAVEGDLLDRADLVDGEHRRADDRPAGLDRQPRHGEAEGAALVLDDLAQLGRRAARGRTGRPGWCRRCRSRRRGRARAARRRARRGPWRAGASTRRAATSKPEVSKICEPMCECRPSSSQPGRLVHRGARPRARRRWRARSRTSGPRGRWRCTRGCAPRRRRSPGPSRRRCRPALARRARPAGRSRANESTMIAADAGSTRARELGERTCCCRGSRSAPDREAGAQRDGQLAAGADVEVQALLGDPAGDRRAQERLAGVVDVGAGERRRGRPAPGRGSRPRRGRTPGCRARRPARARRRRRRSSDAVGLASPSATTAAATRALTSRGRTQPVTGRAARRPRAPSRPRVRWARPSHPLRSGDAEQVEAVGEHGAGRLDQPQAGLGAAASTGSSPLRQHPAGVVEPVVGRRRGPRGSARPGAARAARRRWRPPAGTRRARAAGRPRARGVEQRRVEAVARLRCRARPRCAASTADPGVGVLHVVDRVVAGLPGDLVDVEGQRGVGRVARRASSAARRRRPRRRARPA